MICVFLEKYVISIVRIFEIILSVIHILVLCGSISLLSLSIIGVPYCISNTKLFYIAYLLLWGVSLLEILLSIAQRVVIKIADPFPLSRLEKVISPNKAIKRFIFRVYLESFVYILLLTIADLARRYWLREAFPGGWWGKYVSTMNLLIPLTSIAAKEIHAKLWKTIMS